MYRLRTVKDHSGLRCARNIGTGPSSLSIFLGKVYTPPPLIYRSLEKDVRILLRIYSQNSTSFAGTSFPKIEALPEFT